MATYKDSQQGCESITKLVNVNNTVTYHRTPILGLVLFLAVLPGRRMVTGCWGYPEGLRQFDQRCERQWG